MWSIFFVVFIVVVAFLARAGASVLAAAGVRGAARHASWPRGLAIAFATVFGLLGLLLVVSEFLRWEGTSILVPSLDDGNDRRLEAVLAIGLAAMLCVARLRLIAGPIAGSWVAVNIVTSSVRSLEIWDILSAVTAFWLGMAVCLGTGVEPRRGDAGSVPDETSAGGGFARPPAEHAPTPHQAAPPTAAPHPVPPRPAATHPNAAPWNPQPAGGSFPGAWGPGPAHPGAPYPPRPESGGRSVAPPSGPVHR